MRLTRRQFLIGAAGVTGAGAATAVYATFAATRFMVEPREIRLRRLPPALDGLKLVHVTDVHFGDGIDAAELQSVVGLINDQSPDLVALTGDYISTPMAPSGRAALSGLARRCCEILARIRTRYGIFSSLGNHDYSLRGSMAALLGSHGLNPLVNANRAVTRNGARLWIAGLDDAFHGKLSPHLALRNIPGGECVILLVHEPDVADRIPAGTVDLQLSGHSHGGQVRIPFLPPLYLPSLSQKYPDGLYRVGGMQVFTSRGIGTIRIPMRLNCPPTINVLTLRAESLSRLPDQQ